MKILYQHPQRKENFTHETKPYYYTKGTSRGPENERENLSITTEIKYSKHLVAELEDKAEGIFQKGQKSEH